MDRRAFVMLMRGVVQASRAMVTQSCSINIALTDALLVHEGCDPSGWRGEREEGLVTGEMQRDPSGRRSEREEGVVSLGRAMIPVGGRAREKRAWSLGRSDVPVGVGAREERA